MRHFASLRYIELRRINPQVQGSWTPVSEGVDWNIALTTAETMLRFPRADSYASLSVHYAAALITGDLVLSRITPGGSVEQLEKKLWPRTPDETHLLDHFKATRAAIAERCSGGDPFDTEDDPDSPTSFRWKQTAIFADVEMGLAIDHFQSVERHNPIVLFGLLAECFSIFKKMNPEAYRQAWDAPDTLEVQLVRRDQI